MKLAVIGAGSTYTPELISGLMREQERIDVRELALHDIDPERREVVGGLARRILERQGFSGALAITGELDRALDGADAVLIQIRVGGQAARLRDETIPAACGCVGQETTGAGGLAKAMRTVPVVLEIAQRASELASSDAWIIDFTNPVGIVTRALLDTGHRAIGLCNVAINFQRQIAAHLGVPPERVLVDQLGLNHLTWIRAAWVDGQEVLDEVISNHGARANELRSERGEPPILVHVTPHTFRRTYITFMVAAGYDLPYIQAQVGHLHPTTTLAIYAQLMARRERDQLREEIRELLGVERERADKSLTSNFRAGHAEPGAVRLRAAEKAGKGRKLHR